MLGSRFFLFPARHCRMIGVIDGIEDLGGVLYLFDTGVKHIRLYFPYHHGQERWEGKATGKRPQEKGWISMSYGTSVLSTLQFNFFMSDALA